MNITLIDDDGCPVLTSDFSNGCYTAETEEPPLYVYHAKDLAVMQNVDAALTHEDFGPNTKLTEMRRLLVSQRFRRWALEQHYKLIHVPVMLDGICKY
jgi:hypothetical protein